MVKLPPATNDSVWKTLNEKRQEVYDAGREAHAAGSKAHDSGEEKDHLDAAKAHERAFGMARDMGMGDVAKEHAANAAHHEDAATNPSSPAFKSRVAKEASEAAWKDGTKEAHETAATAHQDAADAHKAKAGGDSWKATMHAGDAKAHAWAATKSPPAK